MSLLALLAASWLGFSGLPLDREPNDTIETAHPVVRTHRGMPGLLAERRAGPAVVIPGRLTPGDVDFFRFGVRAGQVLTVAVEEPGRGAFADPLVGVFGPGSDAPVATNDDGGPGFLSRLSLVAEHTGTWTVGVTGFGDDDFDGEGHAETLDYRLVISVVRDPAWHDEGERGGRNDTARGAKWLFPRLFPPGFFGRAAVVSGSLEPGDVDQFRVLLLHGTELSASLFDLEGGRFNDAVVRVERGVAVLAEDDDAGPGFLANLAFRAPLRGLRAYRVVVTGFDPDPKDDDPHREDFAYQLVLSVARPR